MEIIFLLYFLLLHQHTLAKTCICTDWSLFLYRKTRQNLTDKTWLRTESLPRRDYWPLKKTAKWLLLFLSLFH